MARRDRPAVLPLVENGTFWCVPAKDVHHVRPICSENHAPDDRHGTRRVLPLRVLREYCAGVVET